MAATRDGFTNFMRTKLPGRCGIAFCLLALVTGAAHAGAAPRPETRALTVAEGAIAIDGRDDDWRALGQPLDTVRSAASDARHVTFAFTDRGVYSGSEDISLTSWLAADKTNLYVLAEVHDQLLINDAGADDCFAGDDFEVFIDANPPAARFGEKYNENVRQLIFVPGLVNPRFPNTFVWKAEQNPGVTAASRLRPWGYSIEIKIPKALFPNWAANPDMDSIGFDIEFHKFHLTCFNHVDDLRVRAADQV